MRDCNSSYCYKENGEKAINYNGMFCINDPNNENYKASKTIHISTKISE